LVLTINIKNEPICRREAIQIVGLSLSRRIWKYTFITILAKMTKMEIQGMPICRVVENNLYLI